MKIKFVIILFGVLFLAHPVQAQDQEVLKSKKDKMSYSMGVDIGRTLKSQDLDVDPEILAKGLKDALTERKLLMNDQEMTDTLTTFKEEFLAKKREETKKMGEQNKKEGEAFLSANKKKAGVVTLPSGLQYQVIKPGTGKKPKATDTVTVHYRGTLVNGKEFDSSYRRGKPVTFPVNGVIRGWVEALQLMQEGAKWQLFIPSDLAYGQRGAGPDIGPNATLVFEVELISVGEKK
jgi:FKBP-type peptidyl-prolyl cis-trans isomerase